VILILQNLQNSAEEILNSGKSLKAISSLNKYLTII